VQLLNSRHPASLRTCVLCYKAKGRANPPVKIDYLGFEIPDVWVVGYGLDFAEQFRTLPDIAEMKKI
jgi:hypoxanthine phosphoribosyltransferase